MYRLPSLVEIPTAIRGRLPQVRRVIGLDPEAEFLYVTTPQRDTTSKRKGAKAKSDTTLKSDVLALDLGSARVDTVATAIEQATLGPDGTLYTVDAKGRVVSVARRVRVAWPQPLPAVPQQLFGAADQRLVAADPPKLITAAADQPPTSRFTGRSTSHTESLPVGLARSQRPSGSSRIVSAGSGSATPSISSRSNRSIAASPGSVRRAT